MKNEQKPENSTGWLSVLKNIKLPSPAKAVQGSLDWVKGIFKRDSGWKVLSIIIATGIWAVVSISVYPTIESVYYNVPVKIDLENTYAEANQLDVITASQETVTVRLSGNRSEIGEIKTEDLTAVVDVSNVMIEAYIYDQLVCKGMPQDINERLADGSLQKILYKLYEEGTERGTITVTSNSENIAFSPIYE